jgi:16S rRNA (guanine527-N7)-methyltransferase
MLPAMEADRIAALLEPFMGDASVSRGLAARLQVYLDLLLRWNARINLTAVRDPEQIVTRHFGESLFAARVLEDERALAARPVGILPSPQSTDTFAS